MSLDALKIVLQSADAACNALFGPDDIARWPGGAQEALVEAGLLKQASHATSVVCHGCEEACLSGVEFVSGEDGAPLRAYVVCERRDDIGRVEVPLARLRRWTVDLGSLARSLSAVLGGPGEAEEVVRGRLWRVGRVPAGIDGTEVFLACGTRRDGAAAVFGQPHVFRGSSAPVVLTLSDAPADDVFGGNIGVVPLGRVLSIEDGQLCLDRQAITQAARAVSVVTVQAMGNIFRWDGDGWAAVFEGTTSHYPNGVGMRYVHRLLSHPGRGFGALELARLVDGAPAVSTADAKATRRQALEENGLVEADPTDAGEIMDDEYRRDMRQRLHALNEEIASARRREDTAAEERLEKEKEQLLRFTAGALGLGGKKRKADDPHEKARQRARASIRRALVAIEKKHPTLWAHLLKSLKTGYVLSYEPDRPITWVTD
jgi:hypothetical protein